MEPFTAVWAWIRSGVAVYKQMRRQGRRSLKRFAALLALEGPFLCVDRTVVVQADSVTERLLAHIAGVRPRTAVRTSHVYLKPVGRGKQFTATGTFESC